MADSFIGSVLASITKDTHDTSAVRKVSPSHTQVHMFRRDRTFHRFGDLPIELRLEIWRLALPLPRVLEVYYSKEKGRWLCRRDNYASHSVLKDVSLDSRYVFLKEYLRFLPFERRTTEGQEKLPGTVSFIRPNIDTLYIGSRGGPAPSLDPQKMFALLKKPALKNITQIAFIPELFPATLLATGPKRPSPVGFFKRFKKLKSLTIIIGDSDRYLSDRRADDCLEDWRIIKRNSKIPIAFQKFDWCRECMQHEMERVFQAVVDAFKPGMEAGLEGRDVSLEFTGLLRYGRQSTRWYWYY